MKGKSIMSIFEEFFTDDLLNFIVEQSLTYARQKNNPNFSVNVNEVKIFLGILLFSGYHKLPQQNMYWEQSPDAGVPFVYNAMSRQRFKEIKRFLHLNNNANIDKRDKMYKLRPYLDTLKDNFQKFGIFDSKLSIDEMMVRYYGMHSAKMFMRGKPIKFGYKFWCLCGADGYLYNFSPYLGKGSENSNEPLGVRVISYLTSIIPNAEAVNHEIFFDNFFTSIDILKIQETGS